MPVLRGRKASWIFSTLEICTRVHLFSCSGMISKPLLSAFLSCYEWKKTEPGVHTINTSSDAAAVPRGDVWLLWLPPSCSLHIPGLSKRQHLMQNYAVYGLKEIASKQASVKLCFPWKTLVFQCIAPAVTISRQGHVICITTVINCASDIKTRGKHLWVPETSIYPAPHHLTWALKVLPILGL